MTSYRGLEDIFSGCFKPEGKHRAQVTRGWHKGQEYITTTGHMKTARYAPVHINHEMYMWSWEFYTT